MKKILATLALALCAFSVHAEVIDTSKLSEAQVAELKAIAARSASENEKNKENSKTPSATLSLAAGWGKQAAEAAEGFGKAFNTAARELGITVNDFLGTSAGKLTAALIIWKVAGAGIAKMLFGVVFTTVGLVFARHLYKKLFTKEYTSVQYSHLWGMFTGTKMVRVPKTVGELQTDGEWLALWIIIGVVSASVIFGGVIFVP